MSPLAGYGWTYVCWDKIATIYFTENIKIFLIYTSVSNIWTSYRDFHYHHQYQTEMQQEIWGIQNADDKCDVVYGVTLIAENLCVFL